MATYAILLPDMAYDRPAALKRSWRLLYALALPDGSQERQRRVLTHTDRLVKCPLFHIARPGGGVE